MATQDNQHTVPIRTLTWILVGLLLFAVMVLAFSVGVLVGQERAGFSFRWAEDYHRNFGGPQKGLFGNFPAKELISPHGIYGSVIGVQDATIILKSQNAMEVTATVSGKTIMVKAGKTITLSDIHAGDNIVVIGDPDEQGQIQAKLIRVFPPAN